MPNSITDCSICGCSRGKIYRVRETMFATNQEFEYRECYECGCLFLSHVPSDLSVYYPHSYYSMGRVRYNPLRIVRDWLYLSPLAPIVDWKPRTDLDVIRTCGIRRTQRLLDVGCGAGHLLHDLRQLGYRAEGVDPFISADIRDEFGVRVRKQDLPSVMEMYHVILFRHSLEHMQDQVGMLTEARKRLHPGGMIVVCIPILGWAWRHYHVHWSQLDAPRHLFLHSIESFRRTTRRAGLEITQIVHDSNEFQFWASELYRDGKPLSQASRPSWRKRLWMRRRAAELNARGEGDMAQFYLRVG